MAFKKGETRVFLDYQIIYCTNNDGIVLKHLTRGDYETHLGNYSTLDDAQMAAVVFFMIARPQHFATQIMHKVMRYQSGCVSEFYKFKEVVLQERLEMPEEITPIDGYNNLVGYKGALIGWDKKD